jgi:acetyl-CoA carboxylase carboxyl transferase subunit beta
MEGGWLMANIGWFGRKSKSSTRKIVRQNVDALPDGLWTKCPKCNEILFNKELEKNFRVCGKCNYHFKLGAAERLEFTIDSNSFEEIATDLQTSNPLGFPEYESKLKRDIAKTGLNDPMVVGKATISSIPVVIGVTEFAFIGASMGSVYGEKVVQAAETAIEERRPLIIFCTSGGARMHEGILSLMQMAKTSAAIAKLNEAGLPYITVLTDPTTAGVHASFASIGDVIIAEPGALIGFAGARVAQQAGLINRPANFQTSEFQFEHGMVDMIVPRKDMKQTLTKLIQFCSKEAADVH